MKTLVRRYHIEASIEKVFEAITNQDHIENWTGEIADMDPTPGGKFSLWDGNIIGKNIEVEKNKIIQDWKEETWDSYTKVTIKMKENDSNTDIELIHKDIPTEAFSNISEAWDKFYFDPLKEYVEEEME